MATLPRIVSEPIEAVSDGIRDSLASVVDDIRYNINDMFDSSIRQMKGAFGELDGLKNAITSPLLSIKDFFTIGLTGKLFDKLDGMFPFFNRKDTLPEPVAVVRVTDEDEIAFRDLMLDGLVSIKDAAKIGLAEIVDRLRIISDRDEWRDEKNEFNDDSPTPFLDPKLDDPEVEKKGFLDGLIGGLIGNVKNFFAGIGQALIRALPVVALAGIAAFSFGDIVDQWKNGEKLNEELGMNDGAGGFTAIMAGLEGDMLSQIKAIGKYASVGGGIGLAVGGLPGLIAGAAIGAAIGGVIVGLANFIGYDKINTAVDQTIDYFNSVVEFFMGTNTERLQQRVADMDTALQANQVKMEESIEKIAGLRSDIEAAAARDDSATVNDLQRRLINEESHLAKLEEQRTSFAERQAGFQRELENKNEGLISSILGWNEKIGQYIVTLPLRLMDSIANLLLGQNPLDSWTASFEEIQKTSLTSKYGAFATGVIDSVTDFIGDVLDKMTTLFKDAVDGIWTFFSETVPRKIVELVTQAQAKITGFFDDLIRMGGMIFQEIRLGDLIGLEEVPLMDRVAKRIQEENDAKAAAEKQILDNTERTDSVSDAAVSSTIENHNVSNESSNLNAAQTNVQNNTNNTTNVMKVPLDPYNHDSTARLQGGFGSGGISP